MAHYAIGDLQGCFDELQQLLQQLQFNPAHDRLWLAGDLVNRGPQSLEVLRWVRAHAHCVSTVLGNHDLHLLALAAGHGRARAGDTLDAVLAAPDATELLDWLARQPLALYDGRRLLVHAGLAPQWTVDDCMVLAAEASAALSNPGGRGKLLARMYGDQPSRWDPALLGVDRLRLVINALTRLRYCTADGQLAMKPKGPPGSQPRGVIPWFMVPGRRSAGVPIVFGHWSTLGTVHWPEQHVHGLDTGCIWGGQLSALNLDSGELSQLNCPAHQDPMLE